MRRLSVRLGLLTCFALFAVRCGSPTTPASYTTTWQFLVANVAPGNATPNQYSFTVSSPTTIFVVLVSATSQATGAPLSTPLLVGFGTPSGSTCAATGTQDAAPALTGGIMKSVSPGTYCVSVVDDGSLPEPVTAAVRILAETGTVPTTPTQQTDIFSSELTLNGSAMHTFGNAVTGSLSLLLSNAGGSDKVVRVGLGAWDGSACRLYTTVDTSAGSATQLTATADPSVYCTTVADIGNLTGPVPFSVTITHN